MWLSKIRPMEKIFKSFSERYRQMVLQNFSHKSSFPMCEYFTVYELANCSLGQYKTTTCATHFFSEIMNESNKILKINQGFRSPKINDCARRFFVCQFVSSMWTHVLDIVCYWFSQICCCVIHHSAKQLASSASSTSMTWRGVV